MAVLPAQSQLLREGLLSPPLALQLGPGRLLGRRRPSQRGRGGQPPGHHPHQGQGGEEDEQQKHRVGHRVGPVGEQQEQHDHREAQQQPAAPVFQYIGAVRAAKEPKYQAGQHKRRRQHGHHRIMGQPDIQQLLKD